MAADLIVPPLGESITTAVAALWLRNVGDTVAANEPLLELQTTVTNEQVLSPIAGTLAAQLVEPGATVRVGELVGRVE